MRKKRKKGRQREKRRGVRDRVRGENTEEKEKVGGEVEVRERG